MNSSLPSKKIFFLIIACFVAIGIVSFAAYAKKNDSAKIAKTSGGENSPVVQAISNKLKENSDIDDDKDGLQNWEEILWGTDPKNSDTDKDGTSDGEEANLNRNPLKAGPNDKLSTTKIATATGSGSTVTLEKTETAKISRDLFLKYIEAKRLGLPLDPNVQEQIVGQAFSNKTLSAAYKTYTTSNVRSGTGHDFKKYGNDLGQAFYSGALDSPSSETEIVEAALTQNNPAELNKLDPLINAYSKVISGLELVSVPSEFVGLHVDLLNSMSRIFADIKNFKLVFDDPIVGIMAVSNYFQDFETLKVSIQNLKTEFRTKAVTFEQTDSGYLFSDAI